jgi:hypothetical protein
MANRMEVGSIIAIAGFTLLTAMAGLYLGFVAPRSMPHGKPIPKVPDEGAVVYQMNSVYSKPDRVRLEWKQIEGATGYQVTVFTAEDESLFVSPKIPRNYWIVEPSPGYRLSPQTVYHWKVTAIYPERTETSEAAAFAMQ